MGLEHTAPLSEEVLRLLRAARRRAPVIGDARIVPAPANPANPNSRHLLRDCWRRLEKAAGIRHGRGRGRGWHSLRRWFATTLGHVPLKQLMELGGWRTALKTRRGTASVS
jgi:integrase